MIIIKVTNILLNPLVKSDYTVEVDDEKELNEALLEILKSEQTEREDLAKLVKRFNSSARRFRKGLTDSIFIYTHPAEGVILRIVVDIYQKIPKEVTL